MAARKFHFGGLDGWGYTLCNDFQSLGGQHRHLFDSAEDAHDELNHFFADTNPVEIDGLLAMPPHEHLLYLILHAYKHFIRSGIGLWAREYLEHRYPYLKKHPYLFPDDIDIID